MSLWPFRQAGLKIVSVGVALALWMAVAGEETVERGLRVPIELQQIPVGVDLLGEPPTFADVRVRGTSGTLARLAPGEVVAVLELRGAGPGRRLFQLMPEHIRVPFGLEVTQVVPASVAIEFEQSAVRRVPIAPAIDGQPAPGFIVGAITAEPKDVEITGPASAVASATEALTERVSVAGSRESLVQSVSVGLLSPLLRVKSPRASVRVQIVPAPGQRILRQQPVRLRGVGQNLAAKAVPAGVDVVVRGTREGVANIGIAEVTAFVDLAGLGVGSYSIPVKVETPPRIGALRAEPTAVRVEIQSAKD